MPAPYEYALALRPFGAATVPPGFSEWRKSPTFQHGVVQYPKPLPFDIITAYDLVPLDPQHPFNLTIIKEAFRQHVMDILSRDNIYIMERDEGRGKVVLHFSTRPGVDYQATFFTPENVPTGHMDFTNFDEAVGEMLIFMPKALRSRFKELIPKG